MKIAEEILFVAKKNTPRIMEALQQKVEEVGIANLCYRPIDKKEESLKDVMIVCDNKMNDHRYMGQPFLINELEQSVDNLELKIQTIPNGKVYISHIMSKKKIR